MRPVAFTIIFLTWCAPAQATSWSVKKGSLTYTVNHLFKTFSGVSAKPRGLMRCEKQLCQALFAVKIDTFDSQNSNRDTHMHEAIKEGIFPIAEVSGEVTPLREGRRQEKVVLKIAGKEHIYRLDLEIKKKGSDYQIRTTLPFKLSHFKLERPSLLGAAIDDLIPVTVDLELEHQSD